MHPTSAPIQQMLTRVHAWLCRLSVSAHLNQGRNGDEMSVPIGSITRSSLYAAHCGRCPAGATHECATEKEFVQFLLDLAWIETFNDGWVCPSCFCRPR
jgi:hypothetical protein